METGAVGFVPATLNRSMPFPGKICTGLPAAVDRTACDLGAPALKPSEFARAPRRTVVGASVTVMPPLGQYKAEQLINLGYNRLGIKPEIGVARSIKKWTVEGSTGVWLYTANNCFFPGRARKEHFRHGASPEARDQRVFP